MSIPSKLLTLPSKINIKIPTLPALLHLPTTSTSSSLSSSRYINLRLANKNDIGSILRLNLATLPENYQTSFIQDHLNSWPNLSLIAEHIPDEDVPSHIELQQLVALSVDPTDLDLLIKPRELIAYALGKIESSYITPQTSNIRKSTLHNNAKKRKFPRSPYLQGHVTSISVTPGFRRLKIANQLMLNLHYNMCNVHSAINCGLHVRKSNGPAVQLYGKEFGYVVEKDIEKYYADGEDAFLMRCNFDREFERNILGVEEFFKGGGGGESMVIKNVGG